ncbi:plasmid segregation protein ParM (plasmid) [Arsenophonus nasoniae]|uniref:Plasmid segregation protein ParM n=2 Tax=Arsenophonus nasoniae TaxID=638 RepID=A0A4P7L6S8_9GAMM|nr:plasmid segregation protein ParM [Arsenophonus nasoniae]QBY45994.1 Plasmid segregation protein ParM [Arsenophonus nasoniae]WGM08973.1 plasmid segregation protein ParM [Arsenophonus nasoniae]WGM13668.1 plasmid segregation protein ParM [Arsenophonus nasoniae]WGM18306.1 plasmid segregation protein ParM [Arsenophonus nasoniae]
MKIYIDDGSTNIKLTWSEEGIQKYFISPNSFKRDWSVSFGDSHSSNYTINGEMYSFDAISPIAVTTTNVGYQYSDVNVIAVHHALLQSKLSPQDVEIVVSLPIAEYFDTKNQPNSANIQRKKDNFKKSVEVKDGRTFNIKNVEVMPESIPAGFSIAKALDDLDSLLIVDLGGTTLDIAQVMGKMSGVSKIYGNSHLGVSMMTQSVKEALSLAKTNGSNYLADDIIINSHDMNYLKRRINDASQINQVLASLKESKHRLINRVLDAVNTFSGYTHVMVIGGGAEIIADAIKSHCVTREDRFFKSENPQFDLVNGMFSIG